MKRKRTCHACGKKYGKRSHSSADTYCSKGCHVSKKVEHALTGPNISDLIQAWAASLVGQRVPCRFVRNHRP